MADYSDIIERLEKATEPDRALDYRIAYLVDLRIEGMSCTVREYCDNLSGMDLTQIVASGDRHTSILRHELPPYTASLDAAIALVEAKLPGWSWGAGRDDGRYSSGVEKVTRYDREVYMAVSNNAAIALLIAMFHALQSEEPKP